MLGCFFNYYALAGYGFEFYCRNLGSVKLKALISAVNVAFC